MIFKLYFIAVSIALFTFVRSIPINREDAQACTELCANCKGTATFADDKCECDIGENGKEGAECLRRMRREVGDNGFNLISCDLVGDDRKTRCILGSKHFRTRNSIDQVAKYFMKDGPITGSIFKAPPYSVRSKINDCAEREQAVGQPMDTLNRASFAKAPEYGAPPQQVIINLPQGYMPSDPMTGCGNPEAMTGSTHVMIKSNGVPATPAENVGSPQWITQPKEAVPDQIVEAPHIITQPKKLFSPVTTEPAEPVEPAQPEIKFVKNFKSADHDAPVRVAKPKIGTSTFEIQKPSLSKGKDFASVKMVALPKTISPTFMQSLLHQLSQPMLGIPHALQTITRAPGISQIVSAPGNLLNSLVSRLRTANGLGRTSKGDDGDKSEDLEVATNSKLFNQYDSVNPGDTVLGNENPFSAGVPSTHILVHPVSAYTMPMVQSPVIAGYSPYDREYASQVPTYMVGSSMGSPYFDSDSETYVPIYYNIPKMEHYMTEENDPKAKQAQTAEENVSTPMKEIYKEAPAIKSKKICKKSPKDESFKKVTRDIKAVSQSISEEIMDTNEKNQDYVETTQMTELPKIDRTTTQEPIVEKTPGEERKHSMTKMKTEKVKTEISSKIKKSKGEKKFDVNKK